MIKYFAILVCSLFSLTAIAEQSIQYKDYTIHYNAFNSTVIDANAAKKYQLTRSKFIGMVNIAVIKNNSDGTQSAVKSFNQGTVANLIQQQQALKFTTISEGKAIYYIASFKFADKEHMNFEIAVQPDPNQPAKVITFNQQFYVD